MTYIKTILFSVIILFALFSTSCNKDKGCTDSLANNYDPLAKEDNGSCKYGVNFSPTPYTLDIPPLFQRLILPPYISAQNPLTKQGVELGRQLFHDSLLDGFSGATKTQRFSCSSCHLIQNSFASNDSVVALFNLGWNNVWKWDGKVAGTVEDLFVFEVEHFMHTNLNEINAHSEYPELFKNAFNTDYITYREIEFALAQYFRTFISGNSKFDKYLEATQLGIPNNATLTPQEINGFSIFMSSDKGDCFHCHGSPSQPLWTDNLFHNNGLDASPDQGRAAVTGDPFDIGKFKTPTLRNLVFTAPYMHDSRFSTLDEVIDFYSDGLENSPTIDPLMQLIGQGGSQLSASEKADLKAFLLTLTDSTILTNPDFQTPFN